MEKAATAHTQTPEGAPWRRALYLWAGDLNLTCRHRRELDSRGGAMYAVGGVACP